MGLASTTFTIWIGCREDGGVSGSILLTGAGLDGFSGFGAEGRRVIFVFLPRGEGWEGLVWVSIARSSGVVRPAKKPSEWFCCGFVEVEAALL